MIGREEEEEGKDDDEKENKKITKIIMKKRRKITKEKVRHDITWKKEETDTENTTTKTK